MSIIDNRYLEDATIDKQNLSMKECEIKKLNIELNEKDARITKLKNMYHEKIDETEIKAIFMKNLQDNNYNEDIDEISFPESLVYLK